MEMRSPTPSKRSTRCSSQEGKRSIVRRRREKGIPSPEPTHGRSIPGVSYIATAGPRGSRRRFHRLSLPANFQHNKWREKASRVGVERVEIARPVHINPAAQSELVLLLAAFRPEVID